MSGYELTFRLIGNPKNYDSKFPAIFICIIFRDNYILSRICCSLQENQFPTITPKHISTLMFYWL